MSGEEFLEHVRAASADPQKALELTLSHFDADAGTLHSLGSDGLLHLQAYAGNFPEPLLAVIRTIPVGKGIAGLAVERKAPVDLCNLQTDSSGQARPGAKQTGVRGSLCVPLLAGAEAVGALGVATIREREFTPEETETLLQTGRILAETRS
ncbi:MAG: GAF domain-containing protein [Acidobacteria bacterium]|nr:GAF domain-containing protein [Acidobacteriota bacterium]